ncbi:MAG TPA: SDR family oxidoreductase [Gammaproteobacteria bacterium]
MQKLEFSLAGKVSLVTGASSGIGRDAAGLLAAHGAHVVGVARRKDRLDSLAAEIRHAGGRADVIEFDVTTVDGIGGLFDEVESIAGLPDIVVNSAGIADVAHAVEQTEDDWARMMGVNLDALRRISMEAARRQMVAERPGSIVNIASIAGFGAAPGYAAYSTSKAAVIQLTRSLATELWRFGIRVNALCPGYFRTEINDDFFGSERGKRYVKQIPPRRLGELHELRGPLLLLACDEGSYMTGVALPVDGGHSIRMI